MAVVGTIADDLRARFGEASPLAGSEAWALADGRSGVALFFAYWARTGDDCAAFAARLVEESLEAPRRAGAAGTCSKASPAWPGRWRISTAGCWTVSDGDPNDAIDAALLDLVGTSPWSGEYDLLAGLAGMGVYALERLPRPSGHELLTGVAAWRSWPSRTQPAPSGGRRHTAFRARPPGFPNGA